ncbi:AbiEi antitoxin N-terminal domain-containing protein [Sphingobium sp. WW5]
MLHKLAPGLLVDSAWLQMQGVSRTSIHDYVRRGWLERVASRVYRRTTAHGGHVRQCGVISVLAIGLHFQAALGVICSG